MISRLIEYSVRNRFIVLLLTAAMAVAGVWCVLNTPIDAIPDLSENQVIVFTDWMGRSPQEIDDQITYPLSVNLQGLAGVKAVRSRSEFNFSMINVIFDDKTDFYFARQRILERLGTAATYLPAGVTPYMAPDATALGQIFWYTVEGKDRSLDELRAIQDWYVRYQLYVPGVAEVASVGGFVREYQIDVDPQKLRSYDIPLGAVVSAVQRSNVSVGGKVYFESRAEYLIRGVGWLRGVRDLENVVVAERGGIPITVARLAAVQLGPEYRRSLLEKNGSEAVGGVVMMRYGENPLAVTRAIKERIEQLAGGLPAGVHIVPFYDRTRLIEGAIDTLTHTLREELIVASLAILLILWHFRSALVVCLTLPLAVLVAFILMYAFKIPSNIMSLSGIAISIGILVDASVVMVENATHELTAQFGDGRVRGDTTEIIVRSCRLVGKPIFFAVLIMLISFLPVFALGGQEGKMFHPLAFTKSFAMIGVALLAVTFVPAMIPIFIKGRLRREEENWLVRSFIGVYKPVLTWLMHVPAAGVWFMALLFILGAGLLPASPMELPGGITIARPLFTGVMLATLFFGSVFFRRWWSTGLALLLLIVAAAWSWHLPKLGREFMPPLDEGSILDMPVTVPRVSIAEAGDDIRVRDAVMRGFPEVEQVVGKVGRADTATDPSGIDMVETIVTLRPKSEWLKRKMHFDDTLAEARAVLEAMRQSGWIKAETNAAQGEKLLNAAAMEAATAFDRVMRGLACDELGRHEMMADELDAAAITEINHKLEDRGYAEMDRLLIERLVHHARDAGELIREPTSAEKDALRQSRFAPFTRHTFLWHTTKAGLTKEMDSELQMPGWGNIWTQPIINRVDMLATGVRTMIGVKIYGPRLSDEHGRPGIQSVANQIASILKLIPGAVDVFPDQIVGRSYLQIDIDREKAARYGVNVADVSEAIEVAMGGKTVTTTVEGRQRFPVRVRYARDFWQSAEALRRVLVTGMRGDATPDPDAADMTAPDSSDRQTQAAAGGSAYQVPIADVADIRVVEGPSTIQSENGMLRAYVQLNVRDRDIVGFVEEAQKAVADKLNLPQGFRIEWSGEFENQVRARHTLSMIFPVVILLIFVILYITFNDIRDALLIILAVPGALVGGVIFQSLFGFNFSVAVWVGYIACFGMATQTGIVMLVYLHDAIRSRGGLAAIESLTELRDTIITGAVHRLRPKLMTEGVAIIGLMPMLWAAGVGAEVMRPMAAPVLGGLLVADEVIDLLIPVIFNWYQARQWGRMRAADAVSVAAK